jgi:hypothetical protein
LANVGAVPGAVAIVIVLLVLPIVVCMSGAIAAAVLGQFLTKDAEVRHEDSELLDLNV